MNSQSGKGASAVGKDSRGYDDAKKIDGRKRHVTVNTLARDYERLPQPSEGHLNWALITLMTRRITRNSPRSN